MGIFTPGIEDQWERIDWHLRDRGVNIGPPRSGQTTGGAHATHSNHYRGLARDYGDADSDCNAVIDVMEPLWNVPGLLSELFYAPRGIWHPANVGGHRDHVHVAIYDGAQFGAGPVPPAPSPVDPGVPAGFTEGFDISMYQRGADLAQAKDSGRSFGIFKATEGADYTDSTFGGFWTRAAEIGLFRMAYHFARPSNRNHDAGARQEAEFFFGSVEGNQYAGEFLWLDLEDGGAHGDLSGWVAAFCTRIDELAGPGHVGGYSYVSYWNDHNAGAGLGSRPFWAAAYGAEPSIPHVVWQYSSTEPIPGIGPCDGDNSRDLSPLGAARPLDLADEEDVMITATLPVFNERKLYALSPSVGIYWLLPGGLGQVDRLTGPHHHLGELEWADLEGMVQLDDLKRVIAFTTPAVVWPGTPEPEAPIVTKLATRVAELLGAKPKPKPPKKAVAPRGR